MDNIYTKLSQERKELQQQGLVPEWYTTGGYQMFKSKYEYETNGRSVRAQFERIAKTAAKHVKHVYPEAEEKFFELLWKGWLSPSTPVLANMGTTRGMPVSCSGTVVEDSIDGFYSNLHEVSMLTKNGFGTASDLSHIRPRGTPISAGGKANGVVPVIKEHVQAMRSVSQGNTRRGSWAAYLNIEHGDFHEVLNLLMTEPDDLNIGWTVANTFIEKLNTGDAESISRFQKVMKAKMILGKGYFFFIDKANAKRPQMYVDKNMHINNSQLCVAPETLVLTDEGYQVISDLENEDVNVWNGQRYSKTIVKKTGTNQKLLKVVTNSGFELECTPYHKFYVAMRHPTSGNRWVVEKPTHELKRGDKLIKSNFPVIQGTETLEHAYDNGLFSAEGCYTDQGKRLYLYHEKRELRKHLSDIYRKWTVQDKHNREYAHSELLRNKFFVPSGDFTIQSKLNWFAGLCDGDGTVTRAGKTQSIQVSSINKEFLLEVQMMLQTLGVSAKVTLARESGSRLMPMNDGTDQLGYFDCKACFRLLIGQTGICTIQDMGFKTYRLLLSGHRPNRECTQFVKVTEVLDEGRYDDTYCFTEHKRGMGVFNGILTGQCSEIMLFNDKDHTYSCQPSFAPVLKKGTGLSDIGSVSVGDYIWSREGWTRVVNKVSTGVKEVTEYRTSVGSFIGTSDHRIVQGGEKVEVGKANYVDFVGYEYQTNLDRLNEYIIDGLVTGDGTFRNGKTQLCVGKDDQDYYESEISHMICHNGYKFFRQVKINTVDCSKRTFERDIDLKRLDNPSKIASFLRGLFSANGSCVVQTDDTVQVSLCATSKLVADKSLLLLQALGMNPKLYRSKGRSSTFRNGTYLCKDVYRLIINKSGDIEYFKEHIGFLQNYKMLKLNQRRGTTEKNRKNKSYIKDKLPLGDHEVFHIEVDNSSHTYCTGGLDVSNCVLSSMNAAKWHEWKLTDAPYWATVFLDCVAEEFIERAKHVPGLAKTVRYTERGRSLGLGLCGLHTLFMQDMLPFEGFDAHMLSQDVQSMIWKHAEAATKKMAIDLGEPEWCKGYGKRNTHLCVTGDTEILTRQGFVAIKDTIGQSTDIWNGHEWSQVTPFKTGDKKEILRVELSNGAVVDCTKSHKWLVKNNRHTVKPATKETHELSVGDKLDKWEYPLLDGGEDFPFAYASGFFTGDGSYNQSKPRYQNCLRRKEIRLYGAKKTLVQFLAKKEGCSVRPTSGGGLRFYIEDGVADKFTVPSDNCKLRCKLQWLAGFFDSDGCSGGQLSAKDHLFLQRVQKMAMTCGLYSVLSIRKRSGGYVSNSCYSTLSFSSHALIGMREHGMVTHRVRFRDVNRNSAHYVKVVSVKEQPCADTYCLTDPLRGTALFNGIKTMQCAIAPTKSTALLMGGVSEGINPDPAMTFVQTTAAGEIDRVNPTLLELMKKKGVSSKKHLQEITDKQGSVQHVTWLTDDEKAVFKTAFEINQKVILRLASARSKYIDQWQSLNLFFAADESPEWISEVHEQAFNDPNILALYYVYTQAGVQSSKGECEACQ